MSSYTSNSNFWGKLLLIFVSLLTAYVALGFTLDYLVLRRTTATMYTRLPDSKVKHMNLNHKKGELDVIFMGSSRTEYHISQKSFSDVGLRIYNLGFSGGKLSNYASLLGDAIDANPKKIVLSISIETLYSSDWILPTTIDFDSLFALRSAGVNFGTQIEAFWRLLEGTNRLRTYADAIIGRIKSVYNKFEVKKSLAKKGGKKSKFDFQFDDSECIVAQVTDNQSIKCTNGDSILNGDKLTTKGISKSEILVDLERSKIEYVKTLKRRVEANGIEFVLVLEPTYYTKFSYDLGALEKALDLRVIDNTGLFRDSASLWFDAVHLGYIGKKKYSAHLAAQLKE